MTVGGGGAYGHTDEVGTTNVTADPGRRGAVAVLARKDLLLKRQKYEAAGAASYWVVDPAVPSVLILELRRDRFETVGEIKAEERVSVETPSVPEFRLADLITR